MTTTPVAAPAPWFVTLSVKTTVPLRAGLVGMAKAVSERSADVAVSSSTSPLTNRWVVPESDSNWATA